MKFNHFFISERPAGSGIETYRIALLQLFDDGQGGDLKKGDGIYTAVYRDFLSQSKYKIRVFANGNEGLARVNRSRFVGVGLVKDTPLSRKRRSATRSKRSRRSTRKLKFYPYRQSRSQMSRFSDEQEAAIGNRFDSLTSGMNVAKGDGFWDRTVTLTAAPRGESGKCPIDFTQVMDDCYSVSVREMEHYFAEQHCIDKRASMLVADTTDEIFLALKISKEINRSIWVCCLNIYRLCLI